jgi:fatty-acyl-CoA synthase
LNERVHRLASALRRAGIERGDRVAYLLPNIPEMLEGHFGVPLAGAVLVAINTRLSPSEVGYILRHSGARLLVVDTELAHLVEPELADLPALRTVVSVEDVAGGMRLPGPEYEAFLTGGSPEPVEWPIEDEDETIAIDYTSGTTGRPKGVMYTHRGAYLNSLGELIETRMASDSVYLWTLPMFHCNGWCYPWAVTAIGATHVCLRKPDPAEVWRLVREEGVTPLLRRADGADLAGQLAGGANGAAAAQTHRQHRRRAPVADHHPPGRGARRRDRPRLRPDRGLRPLHRQRVAAPLGRPAAEERARLKARQGVGYLVADDARVVDEAGRDVPADGQTVGEVVMRGNNTMKGYYADPEATAAAFRGGWFHSGDLAVMHPDGYLELRDRKKDIIISGGENISTIEVEQTLCAHPAVLEAAVIAVPDDYWGEVPKAFVALKPGAAATADELIGFVRERLARFKAPKAVEFGDLPKTSTGKVQKFVLREKEWAGREKRIH